MASASPSIDDCENPVCHSKMDSMMSAFGSKKKVAEVGGNEDAKPTDVECPVDREELGSSTWNLLHTIGAYYPEKPSDSMQQKTTAFMQALSELYPCGHCAEDFRKSIDASPPSVSSRTDLSIWLCEQHNEVNKKLEKKTFECTMEALDRRWKHGDPSCNNFKNL